MATYISRVLSSYLSIALSFYRYRIHNWVFVVASAGNKFNWLKRARWEDIVVPAKEHSRVTMVCDFPVVFKSSQTKLNSWIKLILIRSNCDENSIAMCRSHPATHE